MSTSPSAVTLTDQAAMPTGVTSSMMMMHPTSDQDAVTTNQFTVDAPNNTGRLKEESKGLATQHP